MAYVFSDQLSKLSVLLGDSNTGSDDAWPLATRKKEINRGELAFARDSKSIKEYATGTVASGQIAMPSDWLETFSLIVGDRILGPDREISIRDYERYYNYSGTPPYYYYWEFSGTRYIKFFGSANGSTYKLYYFKRPTTELSSDSDTSIIPEEYREASVYYAAAELLQQAGKMQLANQYREVYVGYVRKAQMEAEKHYVDKQYANPDLNIIGSADQDFQGGGWQ